MKFKFIFMKNAQKNTILNEIQTFSKKMFYSKLQEYQSHESKQVVFQIWGWYRQKIITKIKNKKVFSMILFARFSFVSFLYIIYF